MPRDYEMPKPEHVVRNLRMIARQTDIAFARAVVCKQAADEIERLRRELERYNPELEAIHAQRS